MRSEQLTRPVLYSARRNTKERISMKALRYTKDGVLIPGTWVKGWGKPVSVRRGTHMVIIESPERKASRQQLTHLLAKVASSRSGIRTADSRTSGYRSRRGAEAPCASSLTPTFSYQD